MLATKRLNDRPQRLAREVSQPASASAGVRSHRAVVVRGELPYGGSLSRQLQLLWARRVSPSPCSVPHWTGTPGMPPSLGRAQPAGRPRPAISGRGRPVSIGSRCARVEGPLFRRPPPWVVSRWIRLASNVGALATASRISGRSGELLACGRSYRVPAHPGAVTIRTVVLSRLGHERSVKLPVLGHATDAPCSEVGVCVSGGVPLRVSALRPRFGGVVSRLSIWRCPYPIPAHRWHVPLENDLVKVGHLNPSNCRVRLRRRTARW